MERQNLTTRMRNRRLTRLTKAFSKKLENLEHSIALHFFVYKSITHHRTLRIPHGLKAHVAGYVWTWEELIDLIDRSERERNERAGG